MNGFNLSISVKKKEQLLASHKKRMEKTRTFQAHILPTRGPCRTVCILQTEHSAQQSARN